MARGLELAPFEPWLEDKRSFFEFEPGLFVLNHIWRPKLIQMSRDMRRPSDL